MVILAFERLKGVKKVEYKFTIKPIIISAPTEKEAWERLFDEYYTVDPEDVEIDVECIGESDDISHIFDNVTQEEFEKIAKALVGCNTEKIRKEIQGEKE